MDVDTGTFKAITDRLEHLAAKVERLEAWSRGIRDRPLILPQRSFRV